MKYKNNEMYKHIYKDPKLAFRIRQQVYRDKSVTTLNVDWYQKTEYGKYISIGINQDFDIPKSSEQFYVKVDI